MLSSLKSFEGSSDLDEFPRACAYYGIAVVIILQKGTYDAEKKVVKLQSELVGNASKVREITRVFEVVNGNLSYVVQMATNLNSLQPHLKALLKKL
ncbi:hypothetical protein HHK36_003486 [Tetracentron sinense]|uniref:THAP4-like heme-binding domain-containing protein n=1 Tax=Tetracentron sinense TaxID=13715 RepID=A0A834ZNT9_TETSI|nr:hypothetical protein HHK36_003486 [Tetracentron sinense]